MVDETTLLAVALIVAMAKGTGMNGKKGMKNIKNEKSKDNLVPRALFLFALGTRLVQRLLQS